MRVIAGEAGGLRLVSPPGKDTRPTGDRVREATFNALGSLDVLDGARVVDLFAGSGALGIEALSRGAARATFVDRDRAAVEAVQANLRTTGLGDRADVVRVDALTWLVGAVVRGEWFDLALLDPPYAFADWPDLLAAVPAAVAVVESDREVGPGRGWQVIRRRRYGGTVVAIARRLEERIS